MACGGVVTATHQTAQFKQRRVLVEAGHIKPAGIIEIDIPLTDSFKPESRPIVLDLVETISINIVCFPSHGHGVETMDLGCQRMGHLMIVEQTLELRDCVPLTSQRGLVNDTFG